MSQEFKIVEQPFTWNDDMAQIALEDFSTIQKNLSYCVASSIGTALAKLQILEQQGCKVDENNLDKTIQQIEENN